MQNYLLLIVLLSLLSSCDTKNVSNQQVVKNMSELNQAISEASPGSEIVLANGAWNDAQIEFYGEGTEGNPITIKAETPGEVTLEGASSLKLAGEYLVVEGLTFTNGASPSSSVIQYFINDDKLAYHCRISQCVIKDFNKSQKNQQDLWVRFKGRHNQLDHCYLSGKSNRGPTVRVDLEGNANIKNYHKINHNHFGPRPPKGGPSAETLQIGNSSTSMAPSYTMVANNLFDRCNGEVEVISSKSNFNEFRNNVFYKSEGSLVTRHGNYCIVDGNYFIGDDDSPHVGGIRLIGTGHWITNNYFYNLRGEIFRGPLAVMNGIPKSPLNRYIQVTDAVVAYNTWVNCASPWQFGVGSNIDEKDVLPASEIRSETPVRTVVANNIIFNEQGDQMPILRYDSINGIEFRSNVINNQGVDFYGTAGLEENDFSMKELEENIWIPSDNLSAIEPHNGFGFDEIEYDLMGNLRKENNAIGAVNGSNASKPNIMDLNQYGPNWYDAEGSALDPKTIAISTVDELIKAVNNAGDGDIIELNAGQYNLSSPIEINKRITIRSKDANDKSIINYSGSVESSALEMNPNGDLTLSSIILQGNNKNYAFASLKENMSSLYNLNVEDCVISNFEAVLKAYKHSFAEHITFDHTVIKNCNSGIILNSEDDDRGEYNAENVTISDCQFEKVGQSVIDYYRGGYDESTVGGNLVVRNSTFELSGVKDPSGVLIKTYGIINVNITGNKFMNNPVKLVARLWGAKNNAETDNVIERSGQIITEQNLPLKLMY